MILIGYEGSTLNDLKYISREEAHSLMFNSVPSSDINAESKKYFFDEEIKEIKKMRSAFDKLAFAQAEKLVEAHERFRKTVGGSKYNAVTPVLPMDLMGVYILLPNNK
jgi:polyhydroxyalkanoate synthesis regulator phasin